MIEHLPSLAIAWGIQATGVVSPGPGVALILGVAMSEGRRPALATCLGIGIGALVLATLTVSGLAALLAATREAMSVVRWIGALYLGWLAIGAMRRAAVPPVPPAAPAAAKSVGPLSPASSRAQLRRVAGGCLFQLGNPKAILFWIAIAAVGSLDTVSPAALAVFVAGAFVISAGGHAGWALILSSRPARNLYIRARRGIEASLGLLFAFTAFKLATSRI